MSPKNLQQYQFDIARYNTFYITSQLFNLFLCLTTILLEVDDITLIIAWFTYFCKGGIILLCNSDWSNPTLASRQGTIIYKPFILILH